MFWPLSETHLNVTSFFVADFSKGHFATTNKQALSQSPEDILVDELSTKLKVSQQPCYATAVFSCEVLNTFNVGFQMLLMEFFYFEFSDPVSSFKLILTPAYQRTKLQL